MKFNRCMDTNMYKEAIDPNEYNKGMYEMGPMMGMHMGCCQPEVMMCPPIMECPQVRCCHRVINYEVPHIIPCHTKVINHHIYKHTYQPCYSYSEEDETSEIYEPRCCR